MSCPPPARQRQSAHLRLGPKYLSGRAGWDDKRRNAEREKQKKVSAGLSCTGTLTYLVWFIPSRKKETETV